MKRINIYITPDTNNELTALSKIFGTSRSEIIRKSITEYSNMYSKNISSFLNGLDELNINNKSNIMQNYINNPIKFIENFIYIQNNINNNSFNLIKLYNYQKQVISLFEQYNKIIINKSRLIGCSTLIAAYILYYIYINPNKHIAIISPSRNQSNNLLYKINKMQKQFPNELKSQNKCIYDNKTTLKFSNNTIISTGTFNSFRGQYINFLIIDELALFNKLNYDLLTEIEAIQNSNNTTKCIIMSNPNGINTFCKLWIDAVTKYNNYYPIKLPWNITNLHNNKWKENKIKLIGSKRFAQDYECSFISNEGELYAV